MGQSIHCFRAFPFHWQLARLLYCCSGEWVWKGNRDMERLRSKRERKRKALWHLERQGRDPGVCPEGCPPPSLSFLLLNPFLFPTLLCPSIRPTRLHKLAFTSLPTSSSPSLAYLGLVVRLFESSSNSLSKQIHCSSWILLTL